jgi:hypothetical protein
LLNNGSLLDLSDRGKSISSGLWKSKAVRDSSRDGVRDGTGGEVNSRGSGNGNWGSSNGRGSGISSNRGSSSYGSSDSMSSIGVGGSKASVGSTVGKAVSVGDSRVGLSGGGGNSASKNNLNKKMNVTEKFLVVH